MADTRIAGRGLAIGPKVTLGEDGEVILKKSEDGQGTAVWECYADDFEEAEIFTARFIRMLNNVEIARGWFGWASDMVGAFIYPIKTRLSR